MDRPAGLVVSLPLLLAYVMYALANCKLAFTSSTVEGSLVVCLYHAELSPSTPRGGAGLVFMRCPAYHDAGRCSLPCAAEIGGL